MVLSLAALLAAGACAVRGTQQRGLYTSMGYTYYSSPFQEQAALRGDAHDVVFPELGVFDPAGSTFSDFAETLVVPIGATGGRNDPHAEALATLPERCRNTFGVQVSVVGWIFLERSEGEGGSGNARGDTPRAGARGFDPANPAHRSALVSAAVRLQSLGFDGIQVDMEPFPVADVPHVVHLLEEIRSAAGKGFVLSLFCPKYARGVSAQSSHPGYTWQTHRPYRTLARHCDQLVIPLYDYGRLADTEADYRARVEEVVRDVLPRGRLAGRYWLALPAYRHTPDHPPAETAATAMDVMAHLDRRPGGVVLFVHTGDPVDYIPGSVW